LSILQTHTGMLVNGEGLAAPGALLLDLMK
jgi:hypothetical protein